MIATQSMPVVSKVESVPYISADEAYHLLDVQLQRFLALVETLDAGDWQQPTACSRWTVQDILAHQAGSYATGTGYREMVRQYSARPKPGQLPEDAVNDIQVSERAGRSPAELIAELRQVGPIAVRKWAYQFRLVKLLTIPHPVPGKLPVRHLMWVTHSRDTWMHRLDICRATGRKFEPDARQDGRIAALVMRDVGQALGPRLGGDALRFDLTGSGGGQWQVGRGEPAATICMDVLEFNIFASGRFSYEAARARATIVGDEALAERLLRKLLILY